jgi:ABC-type bacteriocin/lantibiotic exporter with double-glycine peptidase domain
MAARWRSDWPFSRSSQSSTSRFFDEPTSNLDEDRRRISLNRSAGYKHFKQSLSLVHDDSFEAYTDQVIMLTEKTGERNRHRAHHEKRLSVVIASRLTLAGVA